MIEDGNEYQLNMQDASVPMMSAISFTSALVDLFSNRTITSQRLTNICSPSSSSSGRQTAGGNPLELEQHDLSLTSARRHLSYSENISTLLSDPCIKCMHSRGPVVREYKVS